MNHVFVQVNYRDIDKKKMLEPHPLAHSFTHRESQVCKAPKHTNIGPALDSGWVNRCVNGCGSIIALAIDIIKKV